MTRIVLLGAGASFGSVDATPSVPPLGMGLFDALVARGGLASELPAELQDIFRSNFEVGMAHLYKHYPSDVMRFQRELAGFVAQFQPGPKNAYVRMIEKLNIRRCLLCTLNYDLLIELAAVRLGHSTVYTSHREAGALRLLKPHGSCNFWPDMGGNIFAGMTFGTGAGPYIKGPIDAISRDETLHRCATDDSFAPAIAMYMPGKEVKISPDFVMEQQRMWASEVEKAFRICIVGTQINPEDSHIWTPLSETTADIHYFGLEDDREHFGEWKEKIRKKNMYFCRSEFAASVPMIAKKLM